MPKRKGCGPPSLVLDRPSKAAMDLAWSYAKGLENFWRNYRLCHGGHEVFSLADAGQLSLRQCVPVFLHGEKGTTYKRDGCFVVSLHSPLGRGTVSNKLGPMGDAPLEPHTNFVGHSFETRFMLGALLKEDYRDYGDNEPYHQLLELVIASLDAASREGVPLSSGERLHPIPIGNKGDWPYLATSAKLVRSYRNVPRAAQSATPCTGICHLCNAGQPLFDYEDVSNTPAFLATLGVDMPWNEEAAFTRVLMHDRGQKPFFSQD